jgi:hypothetical protein
MTAWNLFGAFGAVGIGTALLILGLLSKRLGKATRARSSYAGFYAATFILYVTALLQVANALLNFATPDMLMTEPLWLFAYIGLPALGVTLGIIFAWRYWSWLLAERD